MRAERKYRGVALWVIRDYLIGLGGTLDGEHRIRAPGWSATFREGKPEPIGSIRFNTVHVDFEGDEVVLDRVLKEFRGKMLRPGG